MQNISIFDSTSSKFMFNVKRKETEKNKDTIT